MTRKMIIDTDTASDDAVAIMMALQTPDIQVEAITIVWGNMPVAQGSNNARYTVELCGKHVPVYHGAEKALMRETYHAYWFHGPDGMGGMGYQAKTPPAPGHAVDALIDTIRANPGIMLVTLGPLTNVALAVSQAPDIVGNVSRCVVMGGAACTVGNVTPAAEYNIWCDPEAARIVFRSGLPIEMVGWELCRGEANLTDEEMRYCKEEINTPLAHFAIDCNKSALEANRSWLGDPGLGLPDPVAMAIAIDPTICTRKSKHYVEVECDGTFTRGMTVVDQLGVTPYDTPNVAMWQPLVQRGEPHITVCWEIDARRWKELLYATMRA
ncbi:MAG: nucleoside hydrolase [Anaerolineae bacterium]|nr:MAG: nucleoside hydrolase [Anaerolineae bacterium]GIV82403.1 MAG: nucleoside hydrolase [Anaerolineae bacterium]